MVAQYINLPAYRTPGPLDFSGLNQGLDDLGRSIERNKLLAQQKEIGKALQTGGQSQSQPTAMSSSQPQYGKNALLPDQTVDRIIGVESGGNPYAKNPNSSATGSGQFIDSTWLQTIKQTRPDLAAGKSDQELLSMRTDHGLSREMTGAYASQNAEALQQAGFQPTPGNTYLAHFAGPGGARSVLSADPSTPVSAVLGENVVRANPFLARMTAGDLVNWANNKMGGPSAPAAQPAPQPQQSGSNYANAANIAFGQGNLDIGLQLANAQRAEQEAAYNRQRQGVADQRAAESHELGTQETRDQIQSRLVDRMAGVAQSIRNEADPERKSLMVRKLLTANPRLRQTLSQYGFDPRNPDPTMDMIIAEARGFQAPTKRDFIVAKPGDVVLDPVTQQPVYTAPARTNAGVKPPAGYRYAEDGNLEFIPGGPADPALKVSDVKFSEGATKAANFANMMKAAESQLGQVTENPIGFFGRIAEGLPEGVANPLRSPEYQNYRQAAMQWVRAKLRKESGAAISDAEFEGEFNTYFPQYGDGPQVIAQKNAARAEAQRGMEAESRGAYEQLFGGGPAAQTQPAQVPQQQAVPSAQPVPTGAPQPGQVEDGYRFKGGNPADPNNWEPVQ